VFLRRVVGKYSYDLDERTSSMFRVIYVAQFDVEELGRNRISWLRSVGLFVAFWPIRVSAATTGTMYVSRRRRQNVPPKILNF
jgi:hypothetical protein